MLLCIPQLGGTASVFADWARHGIPELDVAAVQLPGRGVRINELPVERMDWLVQDMGRSIGPSLHESYCVFGQCLGGIIAYELTGWLMMAGYAIPSHLFVSGCGAPDTAGVSSAAADASDEDLIAQIRRWGGTPDEALARPDVMALMLPALRSDLRLFSRYTGASSPQVDVSITAFRGSADPEVTPEAIAGWRHYTTGRFVSREFPGGHFLDAAVLMGAMRQELRGSGLTTRTVAAGKEEWRRF